jgi:hypothetical protein
MMQHINNKSLTLKDILEGIKNLTEEERKILEHELSLMRLQKEFSFISDNLQKRKISQKKGDIQNG